MLTTAGTGFYRAADVMWSHLRLGIVWWLGCLPVVTAPAVTVWLIHAVRAQPTDKAPMGGRAIVRYVLASTLPALRLALVQSAIGIYFVLTLGSAVPDGMLGAVVQVLVITVLITWILTVPWSFLLLERRASGARDAIRSSYLCALRRPDAAALTVAAILAGAMLLALAPTEITVVAALALPPVMLYVPLRCLGAVQKKYIDVQNRKD